MDIQTTNGLPHAHIILTYRHNNYAPEASQHHDSASSIDLIHPGCKLKPIPGLNTP